MKMKMEIILKFVEENANERKLYANNVKCKC